MTKVKICGITNLTDAEYAIECGADAIGFVFEPTSKRYLGNFHEAWDIPRKIEPFIPTCAVFGEFKLPVATELHTAYSFCSMVQFIFKSIYELKKIEKKYLPVVRPTSNSDLESILAETRNLNSLVIDSYSSDEFGGTGKVSDWNFAAEFCTKSNSKVILAGGLTPENVSNAIEIVKPYAVDVSSGVEAEIGKKDHHKVKDFIDAVKSLH